MSEKIRYYLQGELISSLIYILLGAAMIFMPGETVNLICKIIFGIVMIAAGIYHVIIYVLERANATILDMFSGVILLVFGVFLFTHPQIILSVLPVILGAFVIVDSVWVFRGAIRIRKVTKVFWKILLAESILFAVAGGVLMYNPFAANTLMITVAGWMLLADGVLDLIFMFPLRYLLKKAKNAPMTEPDAPIEKEETELEAEEKKEASAEKDRPVLIKKEESEVKEAEEIILDLSGDPADTAEENETKSSEAE